jgi:hypothetical protein
MWCVVRGDPSAPSKLEGAMTEGLGHYYHSFVVVGKSLGDGTDFSALSDDSRIVRIAFFPIFLATHSAEMIDF